ncbi:MAG: heparinase II/III family protein [Candidatus Nealsonbacteria bacterium]|nr:heparinase II/III family protein [Candidatus Nealsonbacteria bacterium]
MNRICTCGVLLTVAVTTHMVAAETDFNYPPTISVEQVREWIDKAPKEHPRLLATRGQLTALRKSVGDDPARKALAAAVVQQANLLEDVPPVTRTLQGRRLLDQSRRCVKRVVVLAMAYHLTGDARHAGRCQKEMLAAARFDDFNPSHFLDTAEMTFALAIGYDWLYEQLDEAARKEIRTAIVEKGVTLPFTTRHKGWVKASNNWGQVCHGGLTAGALAIMEDEPDLAARTVHNALHNVTHSMHAYAPKGSYPEGPGYWAYGTGYNVLLIALLESVTGTDFGLCKAPGFDVTGQYPALMCGPSGQFFNYADGGSGRRPQPALFWFASRYDRPDWLAGERERTAARVASVSSSYAASSSDRLLPLALLWMDDMGDDTGIRMPLHWHSEGETPVTVHRSSWTDLNATYVGFKAGSPSANHGQMDTGSFVLDADGVRWALDLGAEGYHGIESRGMNLWNRSQNSDRWTIFRQSNHGHNTLVIDEQLQRAAGSGKVVAFSDNAKFAHSVIDMTPVYQGQAESVQRGVALLATGEVLIQDQLTGLKPGSRVRWGMITPGEPDDLDGASIVLRQKDVRLTLSILAPQTATWKLIDTAKPRNQWDSPNRGTRMVAFETIAPASGQLTLAVLARPGSCAASDEPKLRALEEWGR